MVHVPVRAGVRVSTGCATTPGGPCAYTGRPLATVHTGLGITADQWDTFLGIITTALDERRVAKADQRDILVLFKAYREETVGL